jgi:protein TonB
VSPAPKTQLREPVNLGVAFSMLLHAAVVGYLVYLVHPKAHFLELPRVMPTVELSPPAPPAQPKPRTPPQHSTPARQAPQAEQLRARAEDAPPAAVAPPAPPQSTPQPPQVTGTAVPPSYFGALEALIQKSLVYPSRSIANSEEGMCRVRVSFARDGAIRDAQLVQDSGYSALDGECRAVFGRIAHFPPVPQDTSPNATDFSIELPITYSLQQ